MAKAKHTTKSKCQEVLTRRVFLTALPASAAAVPAWGAAVADGEGSTPILTLFAEWEAMRIVINASGEGPGYDRLLKKHRALEDRICAMPVTCAADLAAKYMAYTSWGWGGLTCDKPSAAILSDMRKALSPTVVEDVSWAAAKEA